MIKSHRVVAAPDVSMEGSYLAAHWIITNIDNNEEITGEVFNDK